MPDLLSDAWFLLPSAKRNDVRALLQFLESLELRLEEQERQGGGRQVQQALGTTLELFRDLTSPEAPQRPLSRPMLALRDVCLRYGITATAFIGYYDGVQSIRVLQRLRDQRQFDQHVRQVVLGPGLLVAGILAGGPAPRASAESLDLARAWATVGWLTRLGEGLKRGRLYIPLTEISHFELQVGRADDPQLLEVAVRLVDAQMPVLEAGAARCAAIPDQWGRRWAAYQAAQMIDRGRRFLAEPGLVYTAPEKLEAGWRQRIRFLSGR